MKEVIHLRHLDCGIGCHLVLSGSCSVLLKHAFFPFTSEVISSHFTSWFQLIILFYLVDYFNDLLVEPKPRWFLELKYFLKILLYFHCVCIVELQRSWLLNLHLEGCAVTDTNLSPGVFNSIFLLLIFITSFSSYSCAIGSHKYVDYSRINQ